MPRSDDVIHQHNGKDGASQDDDLLLQVLARIPVFGAGLPIYGLLPLWSWRQRMVRERMQPGLARKGRIQ